MLNLTMAHETNYVYTYVSKRSLKTQKWFQIMTAIKCTSTKVASNNSYVSKCGTPPYLSI